MIRSTVCFSEHSRVDCRSRVSAGKNNRRNKSTELHSLKGVDTISYAGLFSEMFMRAWGVREASAGKRELVFGRGRCGGVGAYAIQYQEPRWIFAKNADKLLDDRYAAVLLSGEPIRGRFELE